MWRVFTIEMYMTCILTATVAADNDIVRLSTECESILMWCVCMRNVIPYSSLQQLHIFMAQYAICICISVRTYQLNAIWQHQTPHTTIIQMYWGVHSTLTHTHTHVMMHYHFGFASVAVHCHIAYLWLLICQIPISKIDQRLILVLLYFSFVRRFIYICKIIRI